MKNTIFSVLTIAVLALAACESKPASPKQEATPATEATPKTETPQPAVDSLITGAVKEIQQGKDGYTARIQTADNRVFFATISHANLTDPAQYKTVKTGDTITVKGDQWKMNEEEHITVRVIK